MINNKQFRQYIVVPTLKEIELYSKEAEDLLVGTAAVESHLGTYVHQVGGPALGIYQMEPDTHDDIWDNYLYYRDDLYDIMLYSNIDAPEHTPALMYDLRYATAMARVHYLRVSEAIPRPTEFKAYDDYIYCLGCYWKEHYNTFKGDGDPIDFVNAWDYCGCKT